MPVTVFVSYSHKDARLREKLDSHLNMMRYLGLIEEWYDGQITPGQEWEQEIVSRLNVAHIILLLISADYLASPFCYGKEMKHAIARHNAGEAVVIPVLLRSVEWKDTPFAKLQVLPSNAKPVSNWSTKDDAFTNIAKGIRLVIEDRFIKSPFSVDGIVQILSQTPPEFSGNSSQSNQQIDQLSAASSSVEFTLHQGDITSFDADIVALKYAQYFYGVDEIVASYLNSVGIPVDSIRPQIGKYKYIDTRNSIKANHALFVGVPDLSHFDYQQIREFSSHTLRILANEAPDTRHLAMTIHGVGFGLDENQAIYAQLAGYLDALQSGQLPHALELITIVEINSRRVQRLRQVLEEILNKASYAVRTRDRWSYYLLAQRTNLTSNKKTSMSTRSAAETEIEITKKAHIFVAMPFTKEMEDVFYYGIQRPVHDTGFLCERVDQATFTGDILERVKQKIESAVVVIAELTGANPNVYLEVGYAWGKKRPTILLVKSDQELRFDVRGQKCLKYERIRDLEETLLKELIKLRDEGIIKY